MQEFISKVQDILPVLLILAGLGLLSFAASIIYLPVGLMVGAICLILLGIDSRL
jgi:hypothetical protein